MAKRLTDSEKWQDVWFTELSNDNKIIWLYLLDTCDNAGIFKLNLKLINFNCSTNLSVEEFLSIFKERITQINKESWLINKFCYYQYGPDFLTSKNKAVEKAVVKLIQLGVIKNINGINTLSIGYQYPIDTLQREEEREEEREVEREVEREEEIKVEDQIEVKLKNKKEREEEVEEWDKKFLKEAIEEKVKNERLKNIIINFISGIGLTSNQRDFMFSQKTELVKLIPALKEYI